jgi:hypothetical protein
MAEADELVGVSLGAPATEGSAVIAAIGKRRNSFFMPRSYGQIKRCILQNISGVIRWSFQSLITLAGIACGVQAVK